MRLENRFTSVLSWLLTVGLSSFAVQAGPAPNAIPAGFLSTNQGKIVDNQGRETRIMGVNWFGLESDIMAPHGLWARSYQSMLDQIAALGFNTIRLPFSSAALNAPPTAVGGVNLALNPGLTGKSPLQIMDAVIAYAGLAKVRVILDDHSLEPTSNGESNGLWYSATRSEADWISDWKMLAARYANNPTVIGADLYNEPNGTWGTGKANDWARAAKAAGDAIHTVNPKWLIIAEGVRTYNFNYYWWGGELEAVKKYPIRLARSGKLVYSAHDYPSSIFPQPWFQDSLYPANLAPIWDKYWGYIEAQQIAPVLIGEFGSGLASESDRLWATEIGNYLRVRGVDWIWFPWNANGAPTQGVLGQDWQTPDPARLSYLTDLMSATTRAGTSASR